jgi:FkbM family methyltransferase
MKLDPWAIRSRSKRWINIARGRELFVRRDIDCKAELLGNRGAAFAVCPELLTSDSVVYSFGIGTDISFDRELISRYGVSVHAFDPTPRSIAWLKTQALPPRFCVHEVGLGAYDGMASFAPPKSELHVSHTMVPRTGLTPGIEAPVQRLATIMRELKHARIDLLKIDIEGAEYAAINDFLLSSPPIRQICIEFHHRWPEIGPGKTKEAISALHSAGYRVFHVSASGEEYSFLGPVN